MSLIASISGIRGTIGGGINDGINPINIATFTSAFATFIKRTTPLKSKKIVVGRDGRISGKMIEQIVVGTLEAFGFEVILLGYATTPTTEIAVVHENADGGIIITASHNPKHWNALKLLNHKGEFISASDGETLMSLVESKEFDFAKTEELGYTVRKDYTQQHIADILSLSAVDVDAIKAANLTVAVDCINSVGAVIIPELLKSLGVKKVHLLNDNITGDFAHTAEPLPENLTELSSLVKDKRSDVGFAVDPDVDRLAIICEDGNSFGEENTLIAIADYLLEGTSNKTTVSNLSSSRGLRDITVKHKGEYFTAKVGEVNVVEKMKSVGALIGGEGNGGIIYPEAHYGRDALVGIALYLTLLAKKKVTPSQLLQRLPKYTMGKKKLDLSTDFDIDAALQKVMTTFQGQAEISTEDGVKLDFPEGWVHLRKSNTEPIVRIYSEAQTREEADRLANLVIQIIQH